MSDTPRTDAVFDSVEGGSYPDGTDGVTFTEDACGKLEALCRQLERELIASCEERDRYKAALLKLKSMQIVEQKEIIEEALK